MNPLIATHGQEVSSKSPEQLSFTDRPDTPLNPHGLRHVRRLTVLSSLKSYLLSTKLNLMLLFFPIGIIAEHVGWPSSVVFATNFLAIIPLAKLLGTATEEISLKTGDAVGGLLNATFGNAVELIISIAALSQNLIDVVQTSLLGSILSNLLLVLGLCFLAGGLRYEEQRFNETSAQTSASLLAMSVLSLVIPAAFDMARGRSGQPPDSSTLALSRGVSFILLLLYFLYLYFQLKSHRHLFEAAAQGQTLAEEDEEPTMLFSVAMCALVVVTLCVAVSAEYMVGSIEHVSETAGLPKAFIGMILVPIVGNAAEHMTAVSVALKNKVDLSITVAVGSSMQIALLVTPLITLVGWAMDKPMSLDFQPFETIVLFISVLIVNYLIMDGKSNWLEGVMLLASYAIIAIGFFLL